MDMCCKGCTSRKLHCHSNCDKYKNFVETNEKRKAVEREQKRIDADYHSTVTGHLRYRR